MDPEAQAPAAAPVPVHARPVDRPYERGGERSRSFSHELPPKRVSLIAALQKEEYTGSSWITRDGKEVDIACKLLFNSMLLDYW